MSTFTAEAWQQIHGVRTAIDELPFVSGLRDGSLARERFTYYMAQDAHYLGAYSRVLAACAAQAGDTDEITFWAAGSQRAITVERALHASHVAEVARIEPSPTCTAYTSYLFALAGGGSYATLVAGVLPCFWIYEDVGRRLQASAAAAEGHPYADWISTYGDPAFAAVTEQARRLTDRLAHDAGPSTRRAMHGAFRTAARYEWMFWDAAWRMETWPV